MDHILSTNNDLLTDEFDSKSNSVVNSSDVNFLESFSNSVDHRIHLENQNGEDKSNSQSSEKQLLASKNSSNINENHISPVSCTLNENIPNGDESLASNENDSCVSAVIESQTINKLDVVATEPPSNVKNVENDEEISKIVPASSCESVRNEINLPCSESKTIDSPLKSVTEGDDLPLRFENSTSSDTVASDSSNKEKSTNNNENNFIPTIVEIRGGCVDAVEKSSNECNSPRNEFSSSSLSETPILNIVSVLGSFKESNVDSRASNEAEKMSTIADKTVPVVHISSGDESDNLTASKKCAENPFTNDITIKEEPHENVSDNDCVYFGTEPSSTNFTTEIFIKEEKSSNPENEDAEVICVETTSKIPLPIPIKTETNIEPDSELITTATKPTLKKRTGRSSSSKFDGCVLISSGSDADDSSDSRKRNRFSKTDAAIASGASCVFPATAAGYTCHLCNTVFQEHELLNEHMILHRNNSLIEAKVQNNKPKSKSMKAYTCDICQRQLSTSQSLQQHVLIHRNEKPYSCTVCQKDFRHMSNYRMHVQKHEAEQRRRDKQKSQQALDKSVVRAVDFGRLVGPLFMKETLLHQKERGKADNVNTNSVSDNNVSGNTATNVIKKVVHKSMASVKESPPVLPSYLSFDRPSFRTKENALSHCSSASTILMRKRDMTSDGSKSDDDIRTVKTFNSIENVVMNATRIIVKLDNLDPNLLKRKLQTPDISIDRSPKRCKIMLSPIAEKCNVKLDEIENIPMDDDSTVDDVNSLSYPGNEYETDSAVHDGNAHTVSGYSGCAEPATGSVADRIHGTLTDNELFELLNDDRDAVTPAAHISNRLPSKGDNVNQQVGAQLECDNSSKEVDTRGNGAISSTPKSSNVIFVQTTRDTNDLSGAIESGKDLWNVPDSGGGRDDGYDDDQLDEFDTAFRKVAVRRLALLRKRAAENDGKVESRYLLGPRFWLKALRRAKKRSVESATATSPTSIAASCSAVTSGTPKLWPAATKRYGIRSKMDERRTNDPAKLQSRAENKFKCLLERAKMMNDLNTMNLIGPLFWRRTLQLAGVRRGDDLRTFMRCESFSLAGVEFVGDCGVVSFDDHPSPPQLRVESPASSSSSHRSMTTAERVPAVDDPSTLTPPTPLTGNVVSGRQTLDCRLRRIPSPQPLLPLLQQQQQQHQQSLQQLNATADASTTTVDDILNHDAIETGGKCSAALSEQRTYVLGGNESPSLSSCSPSLNRLSTNKAASSGVFTSTSSVKADNSILYESLTKPKDSKNEYVQPSLSLFSSSTPLNVAANATTVANSVTLLDTNGGPAIDSGRSDSILLLANQAGSKIDNCLVAADRFGRKRNDAVVNADLVTASTLGADTTAPAAAAAAAAATVTATIAAVGNVDETAAKLATIDTGNIILNMDGGGGLQLIAASGDHRGAIGEATNYVLVSDETGTMQYMVNVPSGENYGNFELISDGGVVGEGGGACAAVGDGGDQVAYAIQFDGENYTAVQFVQQDAGGELSTDKNGGKEAKLQADASKTTFLVTNAAAVAGAADQTSHIGKELSDFLNLDYGNLLKNGGADQAS